VVGVTKGDACRAEQVAKPPCCMNLSLPYNLAAFAQQQPLAVHRNASPSTRRHVALTSSRDSGTPKQPLDRRVFAAVRPAWVPTVATHSCRSAVASALQPYLQGKSSTSASSSSNADQAAACDMLTSTAADYVTRWIHEPCNVLLLVYSEVAAAVHSKLLLLLSHLTSRHQRAWTEALT
jgi:hypothetical protein